MFHFHFLIQYCIAILNIGSNISTNDNFCPGRRLNVALDKNGGTCTANDEHTPCTLAIDGRDNPDDSAWMTEREEDGHWIQIDFAISGMVETVDILQHCSHIDKTKSITMEFSDGSSRKVLLQCIDLLQQVSLVPFIIIRA